MRVIQFGITLATSTFHLRFAGLCPPWWIIVCLKDPSMTLVTASLLKFRSLTTCLSSCGLVMISTSFTLPHLHTPMATSFLFLSVNDAFLIAWPTTWTIPTLYPLVTSHASTHIERSECTGTASMDVYLMSELHRWCHWWSSTRVERRE